MTSEIIKCWPSKYKPRKTQADILNWMEQLPSKVKYILVEAPVGAGKSDLAITYSAYLNNCQGDAYILTPQKILQKQYENSFDPKILLSLYGKSSYRCEPKNTNCDIGSDIKPPCENCPHKTALQRSNKSPNMVMNYTLALLLFKYVASEKMIRRRKLIVFDECHTLENHLTEFNAVQIGERRCKQFNTKWKEFKNSDDAFDWVMETYIPAAKIVRDKLFLQVEEIHNNAEFGATVSKADVDILNKYRDISNHCDGINEFVLNGFQKVSERYVFIPDKTFFKYKEIYGKHIFNDIVKPMADRFLFMSSTILDKDAFCQDLGINPAEAAFISVDSEFPLDNRPILYMPKMKMSYGWNSPDKKAERKIMIDAIKDICAHHKDDNGIIHTGSFQIADWLIENLDGKIKHKIMHHGKDSEYSRDIIINEFIEDDSIPKLLISPSITEGLDLKDDKGRFAIFAKVPFLSLADNWTKRRMELSKTWYSRQAMVAMIQGGGRVVRSKDDYGNVYILDESFGMLRNMTSKILPKWWKDSIETM